MISLQKVNKYFNRHKQNQIHVINNTSLELPETGIVTLLGPSGCGKTTLLNAIGGLDKVNSGKIFIDGQNIAGAFSGKKDTIRNAKIGYIFQNFNLLDSKTVFENVAVALRMVGIRDKKVINERVKYCLEAVGIYQLRNKRADALSGGQRQRVAIARAIVKNPRIIIADEPTGNLDSVNTIEVMNIIKTISKERLVILVTHEKKIAEFYSERIIEMKDGSIISDYANDSSKYLDYQLENKIYLKDMPVEKSFRQDGVSVDVYSDEERTAGIKLVIKGGNLYINTGGHFNVVDENMNIEMIDGHYSAMDESIYEGNRFRYDEHLPADFKAKYRSIYTVWNMIQNGFKTIAGFRTLKKLLLLGFVASAMFIFLSVSQVVGIRDVKEKDYLTTNDHYITVSNPKKSIDFVSKLEKLDGVDYAIPGSSLIQMNVPLKDYFQAANAAMPLNGSVCKLNVLPEDSIIAGKMPEDDHDIVVDRMIFDKFFNANSGKNVGVTKYEHFLGRHPEVPNLRDFTIVGVSDTNSPSIYVSEKQLDFILTNAQEGSGDFVYDEYSMSGGMEDYSEYDESGDGESKVLDARLAPSELTIKSGRMPESDYEVIMNNLHAEEYKLGQEISTKVAGKKLTLVGFYTRDMADETLYVNSRTAMLKFMNSKKTVSVYAEDTGAVAEQLEAEGYKYKINYDRDKTAYMKRMKDTMRSAIILAGVILLIALIEMFLMLRSSFLSRIKEVGTLRAIGLKKRDIYRMFTGEILAITVITAIPGIAIMYYLLSNIVKITYYLENQFMLSPQVALISFVIILVFNLIAGLLPVFKTMRKTPAAILARTDI